MTALLTSRRRGGWVRSVLLIAALVVAVLIHHGVEHGASMGPGEPTIVSMASHHQMAGTTAEASSAHTGCAGDQMCEASGIAKTPSMAHPATNASGIHDVSPHLAAGTARQDRGAASPPPTTSVLRI